jgi:hypothetical protein
MKVSDAWIERLELYPLLLDSILWVRSRAAVGLEMGAILELRGVTK